MSFCRVMKIRTIFRLKNASRVVSHEKNFNFPRAIKSHTYRVNERKMKISNFIRIFFAGSSSSYCCIEKP